MTTVYAHLSRIDVARASQVEQGQTIGAVGATGWATGPHLHFEVKVDGVQQDPLLVAQASESDRPDARRPRRSSPSCRRACAPSSASPRRWRTLKSSASRPLAP